VVDRDRGKLFGRDRGGRFGQDDLVEKS